MNKIFAPFLPPWVETGLQPAFYDMESGTVLQQTARMYAKVQQLTRLFNEFSEDVSNEVNNFEHDTNTEIERFEQATNDEIERFEGVVNDTVEEYIEKFNDLHDYVEDYFENLDVQEEINNKLDEMVEDGVLQEIITTYIQSNVAWTFDSVAEMKTATNLTNDSYTQTYGYYAPNDGGRAFYKIRTKTESDVIDEGSIIALYDATLVAELVDNGSVNFKQFGAKGDGTTNDYQAIANCCDYANDNHLLIENKIGNYYVDGSQITLATSVKNEEGVTFILGNSYTQYNSLFIYEHDSTTDVTSVALSTVFSSKGMLTNTYAGKSFVLDTKIKYGQRLDGPDANNTILEPFYCTKTREYLWSIDYDADHVVDLINVSDSFETGYTFDGGRVEQYDTTGYGGSFLTVSRNNCKVKNLDLRCENSQGNNAVIYINYGNNIVLENIACNSDYIGVASYNICMMNVANVVTRNITGNNNSNTFGNRTVKNWLLADSKVSIWDVHWNAFGLLTIDNVEVTGSANLGYGTGIFTVKNSYIGGFIGTNQNYSPIFNGEINVENSNVDDGVHIIRIYTTDANRDAFFDNMILPTVNIKNGPRKFSWDKQDLYIDIPAEAVPYITGKGTILLDHVDLRRIYYAQSATASTGIYDVIFRDCKNISESIMTTANKLGTPVGEGTSLFSNTTSVTPQAGLYTTDTFSGGCTKQGNSVFLNCKGTLAQALGNNAAVISDIPAGYITTTATFGYIYYDDTMQPCYVNAYGKVFNRGPSVPQGKEISIVANYLI